jgi:hypothetical protein
MFVCLIFIFVIKDQIKELKQRKKKKKKKEEKRSNEPSVKYKNEIINYIIKIL